MPMPPESQPAAVSLQSGWRRAALVSGAFSLVALLLLSSTLFFRSATDPAEENRAFSSSELRALKERLKEDPANAELKEAIRELDLELRQEFFARRARTRRYAYLLLAGIVVFLVAVGRGGLVPSAPPEEPSEAPPDEGGREAQHARWALGGLGVLLGLGGLAWGLLSDARLPEEAIGGGAAAAFPTREERLGQWPRFRGEDAHGVAPFTEAPVSWDGPSGENVLWKTAVPRAGRGSPVVWGRGVYLAGADESGREVFGFDAVSGELLWRSVIQIAGSQAETPDVMEDTGYAPSTPATDGRRVYVIFPTGEVGAFDLDGTQVWARNLGPLDNLYGHACSLVVHEEHLFVQLDQGMADDGLSRVLALDVRTGETAWEAAREVDASWSTPLVVPGEDDGPDQVVFNAVPWVISYDAATGEELWRADVLAGEVVPLPIYHEGLLLAMHQDSGVAAIRGDGRGDVTETHVEWTLDIGSPGIPSPLLHEGLLYLQEDDGYLGCYQALDGEQLWEHELMGTFNASPSIVGDHYYATSIEGLTYTLTLGPEPPEELAQSELGEEVFASFAFGEGRIFVRSEQSLFAIGTATP